MKSQDTLWKLRKSWARFQKNILFCKYEVIGEFDLKANMILMNHQSTLDIIALEDLYPKIYVGLPKKN